mmetsp:Transcript_23473/g.47847  ORF Transcript_23473/g.47847 Transcript_23473/m.47847 type:complete len:321 (+) Transcript_23473:1644-2606(+)
MKKPKGILFDLFHKILYGFFLMIRKKKTQGSFPIYSNLTNRFLFQIVTHKPEQEKVIFNYLLEFFQYEERKKKNKNYKNFLFFLDQFKCGVPVVMGRFFFSLSFNNLRSESINFGLFMLRLSYFSIFKKFLPFNFFFHFNDLIRDNFRKKIIENARFFKKNKNFITKNFYFNCLRKQKLNDIKRSTTLTSFFLINNFLSSFFSFLWKKPAKNFELIANAVNLKKFFQVSGSGIIDPFLDFSYRLDGIVPFLSSKKKKNHKETVSFLTCYKKKHVEKFLLKNETKKRMFFMKGKKKKKPQEEKKIEKNVTKLLSSPFPLIF